MRISVTERISLTEFRASDRAACVAYLNDREIFSRTLRIPHPYTEAHFDEWFDVVEQMTRDYGEPLQFVIRDGESLIGSIGFEDLDRGHKAEIGYWLARPRWSQGIMTAVVRAACKYAFENWKLVRITACVCPDNAASARVLEKNEFQFEGLLRKHRRKGEEFLDSRLLALVR